MKIPKTFPDLQALSYAREHARATNDEPALKHFTRLHDRSSAWGGGYGTNIPLLASVLAVAPPGPVLELGAGNFSTLLLSEMCRAMGRTLVTFEADADWLTRFDDLGAQTPPFDGWQCFLGGIGSESFARRKYDHWAIVLVDHAAGPGRTDAIEFLRDRADYIVVHDTNNSFFTGVDDTLSTFRHRFDYTALCPTTTVVSETRPYPPGRWKVTIGEGLPEATVLGAEEMPLEKDYPLLTSRVVVSATHEDRPTSDRPLEGPGEDDVDRETDGADDNEEVAP